MFALKWFIRLGLLGISVVFGLLCCEVLVRYTAPQLVYRFAQGTFVNHPSVHYKLAPNFDGISKTWEYQTSLRTNSLGLREDKEYGKKPPGVYRVLSLGDSFAMGVGVELEDTYVKILERLLESATAGIKFEVINAGVPGYNTVQELTYFQEEGLKLEPDLVLLNFYIGNDVHGNLRTQGSSIVVDGYLQNPVSPPGKLPRQLRFFLNRHSHLYLFIWPLQRQLFDPLMQYREKKRWASWSSIYRVNEDQRTSAMWEKTRELLEEFARVRRHRTKVAVIVIPELSQTDHSRWVTRFKDWETDRFDWQRDKSNKRIVRICKDLGIPVLDLLPAFTQAGSEKPLYFELDHHWTPSGNRLAAEAVHKFLMNQPTLLPFSEQLTLEP